METTARLFVNLPALDELMERIAALEARLAEVEAKVQRLESSAIVVEEEV